MDTPKPGQEPGHVGRFEAHQSVMALIYAYSRFVDRGDFDAISELFARGTFTVAPGQVLTGAAIGERLRSTLRPYDDRTHRTVHLNPNVVVTLDDDLTRAEARTPVQVFQQIAGEIKCIFIGHYRDAFAADGNQWYFTSRTPAVDLVGDMSAHVARGPLAPGPHTRQQDDR